MTLGLLVTRDTFKNAVIGLVKSASTKGHEVIIFFTDDGVKLATDSDVSALATLPGVSMSLCDHSAKHRTIPEDKISEGITVGSQYQNAVLNQDADKVLLI